MRPDGIARVGDRLVAARGARFIGRRAELKVLRSALAPERPPFTVLHVHGPGGVGKTTLLHEFARLASNARRPVIALDGRDLRPSRDEFLGAFGEALRSIGGVADPAAVPARSVVLVDTYEALSSLDAWLRTSFLAQLPADVIVVLAGRRRPALPWRTDLALAAITQAIELANFQLPESAEFLASRGIAATVHANALDFTHGHPLALALVADVLAHRPDAAGFDPKEAPDVVRHLLGLLVEAVPAGACRDALEIGAVARVTTEPLLVDMLGANDGRLAFQWLREQSFIESGDQGVFPHDLVREVLVADARWRDEPGLRKLSRRLYSAVHARAVAAHGRERQRLQMDALYVTRVRPTHAAFFDWRSTDDAHADRAEPGDRDWILDVVRRHEGSESAALAAQWWRVQPGAFHVVRGANDARIGFFAVLDIPPAQATEVGDPAVEAARACIDRHSPIGPGEVAIYLRWLMHADVYQAITVLINLAAMHVLTQCTTRPGLVWNFVALADPAFFQAHFDGVNFARVGDADFSVGGRRYGVFAHDWRFEPPEQWLMGERVPMPFAVSAMPADGVAAPLAQTEFMRAVRAALRDYTRVDALAASPLRLALVAQVSGSTDAAGALRRLLREAVDALNSNPRDLKLHRAVWHTYFEPLATQELVAERLNLPFSTYRHHLTRGVEHIGRSLWQRERLARRV